MPAITRFQIYPNDPAGPRPVEQLTIGRLGIEHHGPVNHEWSLVEAITWIATRDLRMVAGVTPYETNAVATLARGFGAKEIALAERCVANVAAEDIARGFCECARKIDSRACLEDWNALTSEERQSAASDSNAKHRILYRRAHTFRCECFEQAARALFTAAATGRIGATVIGEGKLSRLVWRQADYDLDMGLSLGGRPAGLLSFASATVRRLWPASKAQARNSGAIGRPACNVEAVLAAFRSRRAAGIALEPKQVDEWRRCIEDARANGAEYLGEPATYVKKLKAEYAEARTAEKG